MNFTKILRFEKLFGMMYNGGRKKENWNVERLGVYRADSFITELRV
jgi:hypothetical protein